jgi:iron-sulfur cluster insertion protein
MTKPLFFAAMVLLGISWQNHRSTTRNTTTMSQLQSSQPTIRQPKSLNFTDSAATKVATLILEEENMALKLRAYITGGGCSGFQYGFTFDEKVSDDDKQIAKTVTVKHPDDEDEEGGGESITVTLLIDPMSYQYLVGAEIDYVEDIEGSRFVIRNPNAKTTCGCGQSFSV